MATNRRKNDGLVMIVLLTVLPSKRFLPVSLSTVIMDQQLNQLTPQQRQAVLMRAQQEANQQIMQDMVQRMVKTCFNKCAGTSFPEGDPDIVICFLLEYVAFRIKSTRVEEALQKTIRSPTMMDLNINRLGTALAASLPPSATYTDMSIKENLC
eukprot:scaffold1669_cov129-Cylindrotheca_fusiformis.AAC.12